MKRIIAVVVFIFCASVVNASAARVTLGCNVQQQTIQGNGFDLGFSCTTTVQSVPGSVDVWDYSITVLSSQINGLVLSGTFYASGHRDNALSTWALSGVGHTIHFDAAGDYPGVNPFTVTGNGSSLTFYAPGPVPEGGTLALGLLGCIGLMVTAKVRP